VSLEHEPDSRPEVILLVSDILFHDIFGKTNVPKHQTAAVAALFHPETIKTINMLQALCSVPRKNRTPVAEILVEAKTAQAVIQAAFEVLKLLRNNSVQGLVMVAKIAYAALSRNDFSDYELLSDLCVSCILNVMQDFPTSHDLTWEVRQVVKALVKVHFTEEKSTSHLRTAIEFFIETKAFTQPLLTQQTVMGQDMSMSELTQLLNRMAATHGFSNFDLDAAINDIRAT
jgi:hypothetical protein